MIHVLVVYDISNTNGGISRLRHAANVCMDYGQRVQDSVYECYIDWTNYVVMKNRLANAIDKKLDTVRIYRLGKQINDSVETIGIDKKKCDMAGIITV